MSFLKGNGAPENEVLKGANAPKEMLTYSALREVRGQPPVMVSNAKATNYRGVMAGSKDVTQIQAAYANAIIRAKTQNQTNTTGAQSWKGALFGG